MISRERNKEEAAGRSEIDGESTGTSKIGMRIHLPATRRERSRLEANSWRSRERFIHFVDCQL